jgi:hypothetical protein
MGIRTTKGQKRLKEEWLSIFHDNALAGHSMEPG